MKKNDLPDWLKTSENYYAKPSKFSPISFLVKNIQKFTKLNGQIHQEKNKQIGVIQFVIFILEILLLSMSQSIVFIWVMLIIFLFKIAFSSKSEIVKIFKHTMVSGIMCLAILLPLLLLNWQSFNFIFLAKTLIILLRVNIFITDLTIVGFIELAQKLHLSNSLIFILGIMTKYLKVLNSSLIDQMNAIQIKSIGKLKNPYQMIGGIFGSIYLNSVSISQDVQDAMIARGYTGDFQKAKQVEKASPRRFVSGLVEGTAILCLFILLGR